MKIVDDPIKILKFIPMDPEVYSPIIKINAYKMTKTDCLLVFHEITNYLMNKNSSSDNESIVEVDTYKDKLVHIYPISWYEGLMHHINHTLDEVPKEYSVIKVQIPDPILTEVMSKCRALDNTPICYAAAQRITNLLKDHPDIYNNKSGFINVDAASKYFSSIGKFKTSKFAKYQYYLTQLGIELKII